MNRKTELKEKQNYDFFDLCEILEILRAPGGCPWDAEQTHKSIRKNLIEETYEAAEAIDKEDNELMTEELGDILLQVVFHAQIAKENKEFDINDVCNGICRKLIVRHPHVFGDVKVNGTADVLTNWENIKQQTKNQKTAGETLDDVPRTLPALMRTYKLGKRAAKAGFDFTDFDDAAKRIPSELDELKEAVGKGDEAACKEELGDLLFSVVNAARKLKIDPEEALYESGEKFLKRFKTVEKLALEEGKTISEYSYEQQEELWQKAKKAE